jgi:hypothetical protein
MKNTDLHIHSYYSDGQFSPKELVILAKKRKIKNLALTDHNSVKGVEEAIKEGKKIGVNVIPAVEIECDMGEILAYFIDYKNKKLINTLKIIAKRNEDKTKEKCKKLEKEGYNVSFERIWEKYPKARGNLNSFYYLYTLYKEGYGTTLDLSREIMKNKRLKAKKRRKIKIINIIKLIKSSNGVPVLAHPWLEEKVLREKTFKKVVRAGLKGIEINNGDRYPFKKKGMNKKIRKLAKKYKLIITSGSDYHGKYILKQMPGNHDLGKHNCDEKVIKQLEKATWK